MKPPALPSTLAGAGLVAAGLAVALVAFYIWQRGSVAAAAAGAGQAAGRAVVGAAGGLVVGGVSAASEVVGLPTPSDTMTDPAHVRFFIDRAGYWTASQWAGVPALVAAARMDAGTGTPPPANSPAGRYLAALPAREEPPTVPAANGSPNPAGAIAPADLFDPYSPFIGA